MSGADIAALVLRIAVGGTIMAHGWNHAFGGGKLPGTARWFESIGIRPGRVHALMANHLRNGFFIFRPGEGYEYVLMISLVCVALGALGGGRASLDHAIGLHVPGWAGLLIAAGAGAAGAALVLLTSWRPKKTSATA